MKQTVGRIVQGLAVLGGAAGLGALLVLVLSSYPTRDVALLLVAAALAGVAWLNPRLSIVAVVAAFIFSGLLRRVVPAADPTADAAAIFPFIVALPLAARGATGKKPLAVTALLLWAAVGVVLPGRPPLVGLAAWLNLVVPLLAAFGIRRIPSGLETFARSTVIFGSMAATYGIAQYFVPFRWDVVWLTKADIQSAGVFGQPSFRPFSTLPAPQTAAMLCAVVILVVLFRRQLVGSSTALMVWALSSTSILLLLTLARTVWLALAAALLVGLLATRGRTARQLVPLTVVAVLFVFVTPQGEIVSGRVSTITELSADTSYNARLELLKATGGLATPVGRGLGDFSTASRAVSDRTLDNGYVIVLGELGVFGAGLFVWVLVGLIGQSRRSEYSFVVLLLVSAAGSFVFGNLPGLLLWTFSGIGLSRNATARPSSEPTDRRHPVPSL